VQKVRGKEWLVRNHSLHEGSNTAGWIHLNEVTFPHDLESASCSVPQNSLLSCVPSLDSIPTVVTPEDDLYVLPLTRTSSKTVILIVIYVSSRN
jgi:hypothetical protein